MHATWRRFRRWVKRSITGGLSLLAVSALAWAVHSDLNASQAPLPENTVYYGLSTIAQSAAALAAILASFGLWRFGYLLERYREEEERERQIKDALLPLRVQREYAQETTGVEQPPTSTERTLDLQLTGTDWRRQFYRDEWRELITMLSVFLLVMLAIVALAVIGLAFPESLSPWVWTVRVGMMLAGLCLGIGPLVVIWRAARQSRPR